MAKQRKHPTEAAPVAVIPLNAKAETDLAALFAEPPEFTAEEMMKIVAGEIRPEPTSADVKLVAQEAEAFIGYDHVALAQLAADGQQEIRLIRRFVPKLMQYAADCKESAGPWIELFQRALGEQPALLASALALSGAEGKRAKDTDKKYAAMTEIRAELERWQAGYVKYRNDADFARKMFEIHGATITNEGSIKNSVTSWRKERKSSS